MRASTVIVSHPLLTSEAVGVVPVLDMHRQARPGRDVRLDPAPQLPEGRQRRSAHPHHQMLRPAQWTCTEARHGASGQTPLPDRAAHYRTVHRNTALSCIGHCTGFPETSLLIPSRPRMPTGVCLERSLYPAQFRPTTCSSVLLRSLGPWRLKEDMPNRITSSRLDVILSSPATVAPPR